MGATVGVSHLVLFAIDARGWRDQYRIEGAIDVPSDPIVV